MAPTTLGSSPVILPRVVIGTAIAPNATGAVLATNATDAALMGLIPTAMSITAVTATGVPNPASASSSAPKQNAMMMAWMRWSGDKEPKARRSTRSYPVSSVIRKIQIAVNTIQMIGNNPNAAPSLAASRACPAGIPNAKMATASATTREATPACHAFQRRAPSSTNRVSSGNAATSADNASDPPTGLSTCWNIGTPL